MRAAECSPSVLQRYQRASHLTPPKLAARTPGYVEEGYWIDDHLFYFLADKLIPAQDRVIALPMIADAKTERVGEVIPLQALVKALSDGSNAVDLAALSSADFDMPDRHTLAVSISGKEYLIDVRQRCVFQVRAALAEPAVYSPDGRFACVARGHDLYLIERATGAERALTRDGAEHYSYGQDSETCGAAISNKQQPRAVGLWSRDSQWFLTHRIDERQVPEAAIIQHCPPGSGKPQLHRFKYPLPGDPLPTATYIALHVTSGRIISFDEIKVPVAGSSLFFSRRAWFSGSHTVWLLRFDRYSQQADLIRLDLENGTARIVLSETATAGYLDLHPTVIGSPNVRTLIASNEVIWYSERDGWGHLYLHDISSAALKNRITCGEWQVRDIVHVDETDRRILFLAGGIDPNTDPAQRSLCAVSFDGTGFDILLADDADLFLPPTEPAGLSQDRPYRPSTLSQGISPGARLGVIHVSHVVHGNKTVIFNPVTRRSFTVVETLPTPGQTPPRLFSCLAADRTTQLHGVMFLPPDFNEKEIYPLIDYVYPGPHVAHQPQSFAAVRAAQAMVLAELGFITLMLDTRGTPFGSRAFHQAGYGAFLEPQLSDHAAVARQLCERHSFVRADRIGIIGQSAGGAAAARALFEYGDIFKVGVAACGSHDASQVVAGWSDKYRGPSGEGSWREKPNAAVAHQLRGKLLLISGDLDENVHLSQTLSLVDSLIVANRDFELLIVPNAGHGVLLDNGYAQRRAWDYFVRHLQDREPPAGFELRFEPRELVLFEKIFLREYR